MINFKVWHVLRDIETDKRSCCYYDEEEPFLDFGEPDPLAGKEIISPEKWTAKEIGDIISSVLEYEGVSNLVFLPEVILQAMEDYGIDEDTKAKIMQKIMLNLMQRNSD